MIKIIRKRTGNINIPFELKKSSVFHRIADITDKDLLFPGTIIVKPTLLPPSDLVEISWKLTNLTKNYVVSEGTGQDTFNNLEPGLYSVEYYPINGYVTPNVSVKNLGERQTVTFDSVYNEGETTTGNDYGTINVFMNLIIGGWKIELVDENNEPIYSIPEEGYSSSLEFSQGGLPLGKYRITVKELSTPIISPLETERIKYLTSESPSISWTVTYDNPTQFETKLDVNATDSEIKWELDAKYREDEPILGIGTNLQLPIFIPTNNEPWRLKINDESKQFERHIIRVNANSPVTDVLFRDAENDAYYYGYDDDRLLFNLFENEVNIYAKNTENFIIPRMMFTFAGKNYVNTHGHGGDFMQIFNPFITNSYYSDVSFIVKRYWNPSDVDPSNTLNVGSRRLHSHGNFYTTNPRQVTDFFNIGFFKIEVSKSSLLTLFNLELNSQGDPVKLTTAYSSRGTESPILVIDLDSNIIPVIDISQ